MFGWDKLTDAGKMTVVAVCAAVIVVLFVLLQNILRPIIVLLVSLAVGFAVAGYYNMLLKENADWRMYATGFGVLLPTTGVAWLFLGTGWLVLFAAYTGGLTLALFLLEKRGVGILPKSDK